MKPRFWDLKNFTYSYFSISGARRRTILSELESKVIFLNKLQVLKHLLEEVTAFRLFL